MQANSNGPIQRENYKYHMKSISVMSIELPAMANFNQTDCLNLLLFGTHLDDEGLNGGGGR